MDLCKPTLAKKLLIFELHQFYPNIENIATFSS